MRFPLILFLIVTLTGELAAQRRDDGAIFFDILSFAGPTPDTTRLDIYLAVPYTSLRFERDAGAYRGGYQIRLRIEGSGGRAGLDTTWTRSIRTFSYDATIGRTGAVEFFQQRFNTVPGEYTASLEVIDLVTNTTVTMSKKTTAVDFAHARFALSSPLLVSKIREDSIGRHSIVPMTNDLVPHEEQFFLFFEVYNRGDSVATSFSGRIVDGRGGALGEQQLWERMVPPGRSQQWVRVSTTGAPRGPFTLTLRARRADDTTRELGTTSRGVRFEGGSFGISLNDEELTGRIEQLRYVASQSDIDRIREGSSFTERQRLYGAFWNGLDPTPGTLLNEAMEEYFIRIEHANENFRSYAAGWLTDKGRVWVIYGQPDNITTDPFRNDGKAVENWYYSRRNLRLTFVDASGFGDFRLATPIPLGEKFRYP